MNLRDQIRKDLVKAANELGLKTDLVEITRPQDPANGDYSTNLALRRFTPQGKPCVHTERSEVRTRGVEPPPLTGHAPQACAYTRFRHVRLFLYFIKR